MCKFSKGLELDRDVLLSEGMTSTVTIHDTSGRIIWCATQDQIDDDAKYIDTMPTAWIDPADHARVNVSIASAARGNTVSCRYLLNASLYGGKSWQVTTIWQPGPNHHAAIVGVSRTYTPIVAKLTKAERELCKLLAALDEKSSAVLQWKKSSTLRSAKSRLARKLGILPSQLPAFCATYGDIICH